MFLFTYRSWVQILRMNHHSSGEDGSTRKQPEHGVLNILVRIPAIVNTIVNSRSKRW